MKIGLVVSAFFALVATGLIFKFFIWGEGDMVQALILLAIGMCSGGILTAIDEAETRLGCHIFNKRCISDNDSSTNQSL